MLNFNQTKALKIFLQKYFLNKDLNKIDYLQQKIGKAIGLYKR